MAITRCINLDWVEFYCLESVEEFPCDAEYFRRHGYCVYERDYGTRQYEQMFTVLDEHDLGFVEIRRKPVSGMLADRVRGIFSPYSCHIKLCNRYCYADNAMTRFSVTFLQNMATGFSESSVLTFVLISRSSTLEMIQTTFSADT